MSKAYENTFMNTKEVAGFLKVNEKMVYSLITEKGLPATKVTGKWMFPRRLVEEWLEMNILNHRQTELDMSSDTGRLLLAGSDDPLFRQTVALFHRKHPETVAFFAELGSMGGLKCLRRGLCHIGVCHLLEDDTHTYRFDFSDRELTNPPVFLNFSRREQGILLAHGNPKNIRSIDDLARPGIRVVNRPLGSGTRLVFDYEVSGSEISTDEIDGYRDELPRQMDVGLAILAGRADAGPGLHAVAGLLGLDFLPLRWERFDLLISRERFFEEGIQRFLGILHDMSFQRLAESFIGYDLSLCGRMILPDSPPEDE